MIIRIPSSNKRKLLMSIIAIAIVVGSFFYSDYLSKRIAEREKRQMEEWIAAQQTIANADIGEDLTLASIIIAEQKTIPVIETNELDSIMGFLNLDSSKAKKNESYLQSILNTYKKKSRFIKTYIDADQKKFNTYYYGESSLLRQVRYFPLLQLLIVVLFTSMMIVSINNRNKSIQNQLWAGLAKETAHQLGTPISALSGWTTILKEGANQEEILPEMEKDIDRLKLISERFSMIGGTPKKEKVVLQEIIQHVVTYIKKRASKQVSFIFDFPSHSILLNLTPELIEWVIENICKNGLDAMEGSGTITLSVHETENEIQLDISDTGRGIPLTLQDEIFNPGVSTKKRGWGVGLTLAKRIIEEYHNGKLFILQSTVGKGTTFRISFKK